MAAEKSLSASLARQRAQKATDCYDMQEKAIRKAELLGRRGME